MKQQCKMWQVSSRHNFDKLTEFLTNFFFLNDQKASNILRIIDFESYHLDIIEYLQKLFINKYGNGEGFTYCKSWKKKRRLYMFFIANIKILDWDISDTVTKLPCLQVVHIVNIRIRLKETFKTVIVARFSCWISESPKIIILPLLIT